MTARQALDVKPAAVFAILQRYPRRSFETSEVCTMVGVRTPPLDKVYSDMPMDDVHAVIWALCRLREQEKITRTDAEGRRTLWRYDPPKTDDDAVLFDVRYIVPPHAYEKYMR